MPRSQSTTKHFLQPGIDNIHDGAVGVCVPVAARLPDGIGDDSLEDLVRSLHDVDVQPRRYVPGDVAMERPHAWVVGDELEGNEAGDAVRRRLDDLHITSLGVLLVNNGPVPCAHSLGEDVEIVPVQMHRMRSAAEIFDEDPDAVVGAEVVHVPLGIKGIRGVSLVGQQENRIVHVPAEALTVHQP